MESKLVPEPEAFEGYNKNNFADIINLKPGETDITMHYELANKEKNEVNELLKTYIDEGGKEHCLYSSLEKIKGWLKEKKDKDLENKEGR
jgi:uncharacterized protein YqeY